MEAAFVIYLRYKTLVALLIVDRCDDAFVAKILANDENGDEWQWEDDVR